MKFLLSFPTLASFLLIISLIALHYQYRRCAYVLIMIVIIANYLFATPVMTQLIFSIIGKYPPLNMQQFVQNQSQAQAIVVLGGGLYIGKEYGNVYQSGWATTQRLQYTAYLAKSTHLPVVLSGMEVAYGMNNTLQQLGVTAKWLESQSYDTHENAQLSAKLLHKQGIKNIVLVTDAWHMSRAVFAFEHAGFTVIAAPTDFPEGYFKQPPRLWQPNVINFINNSRGWSEIFGHIKYRLRYKFID